MKRLITLILFCSITQLFSQSGGGSDFIKEIINNSSVTVNMNQSFYDKDWNDVIDEMEDMGASVDENPFRRINFTFMGQFDGDVLGGFKYLKYGFDIDASDESSDYGSESSIAIELNFLKLFVTYPVGKGLYFGVEGGYFLEGEYKSKFTSDSGSESDKETIEREDWTDIELSEFDYGLLGQYFFNIQPKLLLTVEGYYGLSKFSEDNDSSELGIPNRFHYLSLGLTYKLGG